MGFTARTGDTQEVLSSYENFPAVAATSRIVDLMEIAAARLMRRKLRSTETSVGIELRMNFLAPARAGSNARAVAAYEGICGRVHRIAVNVFDETGLIASAELTRAVVEPGKLLVGAPRRAKPPALVLRALPDAS